MCRFCLNRLFPVLLLLVLGWATGSPAAGAAAGAAPTAPTAPAPPTGTEPDAGGGSPPTDPATPSKPAGVVPGNNVDELEYALDAVVEELIDAYNRKDAHAFFGHFARQMSAITNEGVFKSMYVDGYYTQLGRCQSRSLDRGRCQINPMCPLLVYDAAFEHAERVTITVNFVLENRLLKVLQVQFEKVEP